MLIIFYQPFDEMVSLSNVPPTIFIKIAIPHLKIKIIMLLTHV